jgi:FkbM family methyltransferase
MTSPSPTVPTFRQGLRNWARSSLLKLGWDLRRTVNYEDTVRAEWHRRELVKWRVLHSYQPATLLDIGANTGQFAALVRELLPTTRIISFEPLRECYEALQQQSASLAPHEVWPYALGETDGVTVMQRNDFSPSSSLLAMGELHRTELPHTSNTVNEEIQLRRLDGIANELALNDPLFIKIDVQGYTMPVLRGGENTIRRATAVVAEVSVQSLYHGEATFDDVYALMTQWGFRYRGNVDQWASERDGRILQCDCLFEKVKSA